MRAEHQLIWIEDPTNQETDFDRNYLRHHVMPILQQRWPGVSQTLARSASHCAHAADVINQQAAADYQQVYRGNELQISQLLLLSNERQSEVLRYWIEQRHLSLPSTAQLQQLKQQLLQSREDAQPQVRWPGACIRRYHDFLYADSEECVEDLRDKILEWDLSTPLTLPNNLGILTVQPTQGAGINLQHVNQAPLTIRFRQGGERCHPATFVPIAKP